MVAMNENYSNRRTDVATPDGGVTTYTWTDDNQLAAVANSGGTVTSTYDGDGLRFSRADAKGITGLIQIKNPSGHGIDVAGHDLMQAVFGEFKASLSEKAPGLSIAQQDFEMFIESRLQLASGQTPLLSGKRAWAATSTEMRDAAQSFLRDFQLTRATGAAPRGYVVEITNLGKIKYRMVIRKWH